MRGFAQFGLNRFERGQKSFNQLQLSLDTDRIKSFNCVCSSITARRGYAKLYIGAVITVSVPKCTSNIDAYYTKI